MPFKLNVYLSASYIEIKIFIFKKCSSLEHIFVSDGNNKLISLLYQDSAYWLDNRPNEDNEHEKSKSTHFGN